MNILLLLHQELHLLGFIPETQADRLEIIHVYLGKLWQEQLQMERSCLAGAGGGARLGSGMGSWLHTDAHTWNVDSSGGHCRRIQTVPTFPCTGAEPGCAQGSGSTGQGPCSPTPGLRVAIF